MKNEENEPEKKKKNIPIKELITKNKYAFPKKKAISGINNLAFIMKSFVIKSHIFSALLKLINLHFTL